MPAVRVSPRETDSSPAHRTEITLICVILGGFSGVFFLALLVRWIMNRRRTQKHRYEHKPRSIEPFPYQTTPFDIWESSGRAPLLRTESHPYSRNSLNSTLTLHEYSCPPITQHAWDSHQYTYITPEDHLPQVPPPVPYPTQSLFNADPFLPSLHTASDSDHCSPSSPRPGLLPSPSFHQEPMKSLQVSPKHLPRLVIPNAASMPRSARAIENPKDAHSELSSASEYSQPSASSSFIQQSFHSRGLAPPPVPPLPDYIIVQGRFQDEPVGLGRTNTIEIASLLKDRVKHGGNLLRAPSNISHIER
ncbi:hypothetical protein DFS33DRAFT_7489 [Desarmillaria ectypa]|nr:hypothetical protein DFS33DRAFT_7489 [Desarmillaria ectypa]